MFTLKGTITTDRSDTHEINKDCGVVTIKGGEDRCWVTNALVTPGSIIIPTLRTWDETAKSVQAVEQEENSFVLRLNAEASSDVSVSFIIVTVDVT